jgi:Translation initiation factor IF-2, N-terminal region/Zc3h12a-like Ribonuclease NYN domain
VSNHVIVDGSNLATEGRTLPSLSQLEDAVAAYRDEHPNAELVVVVDATFEHRVESKKERDRFKQLEVEAKMVTPPAGAVGRGDAFILKIAQKMNAVVLSNDSFQEFHGEYPWLFETGRLIGGKPIPGVGWVFTARTPVRGPKSREATKKAAIPVAPIKKLALARPDGTKARIGDTFTPKALVPEPIRVHQLAKELGVESKEILAYAKKAKVEAKSHQSMLEPKTADKLRELHRNASKISITQLAKQLGAKSGELVALAKAAKIQVGSGATKVDPSEAELLTKALEKSRRPAPEPQVSTPKPQRSRRARGSGSGRSEEASTQSTQASTSNSPIDFITFLAAHKVGSTITALVTGFSSHGASATVDLGDGRSFSCYVPTARLGNPPPRRARDVLSKGSRYSFTLAEVDASRRVAELALSDSATNAGGGATQAAPAKAKKAAGSSAKKTATKKAAATSSAAAPKEPAHKAKRATPAKSTKKAPVKKATAAGNQTKSASKPAAKALSAKKRG